MVGAYRRYQAEAEDLELWSPGAHRLVGGFVENLVREPFQEFKVLGSLESHQGFSRMECRLKGMRELLSFGPSGLWSCQVVQGLSSIPSLE